MPQARTETPALFYLLIIPYLAARPITPNVHRSQTNPRSVVELKADEDIHLPQGLDYWSRVQWHHARGEFQQFGYFPGCELPPADPLLFLVAPTLHIHPATDTVLRYLAPEIDWTLVGIDERWRDGVRAIFRKRAKKQDLPRRHRDTEETPTQRLCASE
jgi:hypothetical protein